MHPDGVALHIKASPVSTSGRIRVSAEVRERFPGFRASVVFAMGLRNSPSTPTSRAWLQAGAERGLAALRSGPPKDHPSIRNWRDAYSAFGAKPSAYPCSAEALLQRALKEGADAVPAINVLVDAYNAASLAYLLPIGGEDLDQVSGCCELRFAQAGDCRAEGDDASNAPKPGEAVWADDRGWTCRRWNWRQGIRTRLTEQTRNAYFLVEGMASATYEPDIDGAVNELCRRIVESVRPANLEVEQLIPSRAPSAAGIA
jgi:DNA/RNA-binding domain of Phe-tRNA-synthetase-like protein